MWFNIHFVRTMSHNSSIIQSNSLAIIYQKIRDESFDSLNGYNWQSLWRYMAYCAACETTLSHH